MRNETGGTGPVSATTRGAVRGGSTPVCATNLALRPGASASGAGVAAGGETLAFASTGAFTGIRVCATGTCGAAAIVGCGAPTGPGTVTGAGAMTTGGVTFPASTPCVVACVAYQAKRSSATHTTPTRPIRLPVRAMETLPPPTGTLWVPWCKASTKAGRTDADSVGCKTWRWSKSRNILLTTLTAYLPCQTYGTGP